MGKRLYVTPKGTVLQENFPQIYNHQDYQDYAVAMNLLCMIWVDADLYNDARNGNVFLIPEVIWNDTCTDLSFLFSFSAAIVRFSNNILKMKPLVQSMGALSKENRADLSVKALFERHPDSFPGIKKEVQFAEVFGKGLLTLDGAAELCFKKNLIRFLDDINIGMGAVVLKDIHEIFDPRKSSIQGAIIDFLSRLIYVRWTLGRPDSFLGQILKYKEQLKEVWTLFSKPDIWDLLKKMKKVSEENEAWFLSDGIHFFKEDKPLRASDIACIDKFITGLLDQDQSQLFPVVSQYLNVLSIIKSPAYSCKELQQSFQGLLNSFKK